MRTTKIPSGWPDTKPRRSRHALTVLALVVGLPVITLGTKAAADAVQDWNYDRGLDHSITRTKADGYGYPGDPATRSGISIWGGCKPGHTLHADMYFMPRTSTVTLTITAPGVPPRTATVKTDEYGVGHWTGDWPASNPTTATVTAHDQQGRTSKTLHISFADCG